MSARRGSSRITVAPSSTGHQSPSVPQDDIGLNLKPPRAMGVSTVKVENDGEWQGLEALAELERLTGVALLEPEDRALHAWPAARL